MHMVNELAKVFGERGSSPLLKSESGLTLASSQVAELGAGRAFRRVCRRLVFCLMGNDIGSLAGYFGLILAGAVPLMLGHSVNIAQLKELIRLYRPGYIWLPAVRKSELEKVDCLLTYENYCLLELHNPAFEIHDSLALLLGTSGSTGSPQFVRLSHNNVLSNAEAIVQYLDLNADEVPITTLSPSYTYGLSIIHSHVLAGATIAVTNKTFFDRAFWKFLRDVNATSMGGVPYHYEMLKKLRFTKMELPSLRTLTQAGGRMEPALVREYAKYCTSRGLRFFVMYGQAEASPRMSYLAPKKAIVKPGSIGNAIPGGRFRLEDGEGGAIQRAGVAGELVYEGTNVFMGYAQGYEDLVKGDEHQGVLRTGDLAHRDDGGDYYIVGRLKRFIKLYGHRVNLLDVENFLLASGHPVACAGKDDCLEIYIPKPAAEQAPKLKKLVAEYLHVALQGVVVYGIEGFPRNESGKVQYAKLRPQLGTLLA